MTTQPIEDWGDAIFLSLTNTINTLLAALPAIIGALLLLLIGWWLSGVLGRFTARALRGAGADRLFVRHAEGVYPEQAMRYQPSDVGGEIVKWALRIVFLVAAANLLGLTQVSELLNQVILWIPNLIVAAIVLLVAPIIARFVGGAIEVGAGQLGFTNAPLLGRITRYAILAFAVLVAINQLGIATNLINTLFIGVVAAIALAFGLAFGLGGRDVASEITRQWYESTRQTAQRVRERAGEAARASAGAGAPGAATGPREARVESAATARATDTRLE